LLEILPLKGMWIIMVKAWLKQPDNILKLYEVEITSTKRGRLTHKHDVIIHVKDVLEASRGIIDYI
jgi:predicted small secreted protein